MSVEVAEPTEPSRAHAREAERHRGLDPASAIALLGTAAIVLAVLVWMGFYWVAPNTDWIYALAWGDALAEGEDPDVVHPFAPLPHPLPMLIGIALSPLAAEGSFDAVAIFNALCWFLPGIGAFRLARVMAGSQHAAYAGAAGLLAAILVMTRGRVEFFAARGAVDVPFAGLVLLALSYLVEDPRRRPLRPLALLFVAGLLRPDDWLIGLGYCAWLAYERLPLRRLAGCVALALAAPLTWVLLSLALTGNALSPVEGNPEAASLAEYGFNAVEGRTGGTIYSDEAHSITDDVIDRVRSVLGDEPALVGLLAILWCALGLVPALRPPGWGRYAVVGALVPLLLVQTVILVDLGAPLSDRYVITPALLLIVLAAAFLWRLPRPGVAAAASVLLVAATLTAALTAGGRLIWPTLPIVREEVAKAKEERLEQNDLYQLADRAKVGSAIKAGCDEVAVGGLGGPHFVLQAKPLIAQALGIETGEVAFGPKPPLGPRSANFTRDLPPQPGPSASEGIWRFQSPCLE